MDESESAASARDLFWRLLLVASLIAAIVSLLTTGLGLSGYLTPLLAWPLALAVQMGLFGLAWLIAVGRRSLRGLVVGLYLLTMPFSVVFSYVLLQSEITKKVRPVESQRALEDELRGRASDLLAILQRGVAESQELQLRLDSWQDVERSTGWSLSVCAEEKQCYLREVCDRLRRKVASWEETYGRPYHQGPGEQLIFAQLDTEIGALEQIRTSLTAASADWLETSDVLAPDLDNRQRLLRFDRALGRLPVRDLETVQCQAVVIPKAPDYEDFARDSAVDEERPLYAFEDLTRVFDAEHTINRSDYPTLFAFGLALFIDLFVLAVALGAGVMEESGELGTRHRLSSPFAWGSHLRAQIESWIDGSLLRPQATREDRRAFLGQILKALRFDGGSRAVLVPEDAEQSRFGHLLAQARAAVPSRQKGPEKVSFVLEDWVYNALAQYLTVEV